MFRSRVYFAAFIPGTAGMVANKPPTGRPEIVRTRVGSEPSSPQRPIGAPTSTSNETDDDITEDDLERGKANYPNLSMEEYRIVLKSQRREQNEDSKTETRRQQRGMQNRELHWTQRWFPFLSTNHAQSGHAHLRRQLQAQEYKTQQEAMQRQAASGTSGAGPPVVDARSFTEGSTKSQNLSPGELYMANLGHVTSEGGGGQYHRPVVSKVEEELARQDAQWQRESESLFQYEPVVNVDKAAISPSTPSASSATPTNATEESNPNQHIVGLPGGVKVDGLSRTRAVDGDASKDHTEAQQLAEKERKLAQEAEYSEFKRKAEAYKKTPLAGKETAASEKIPLGNRWWFPYVCISTIALVWCPDFYKVYLLCLLDDQYDHLKDRVHLWYWKRTMDPETYEKLKSQIENKVTKSELLKERSNCPL